MRIFARLFSAGLILSVLMAAAPRTAVAQDAPMNGWLHLGYRTLSLSGGAYSEWKYNEDYDYQDGVRLLGMALKGSLAGHEYTLNADGLGPEADPVATMNGSFRSPGKFVLTFGGYNARYFHTTASYVDDYDLGGIPFSYTRRGRYADLAVTAGGLPEFHIRYDSFRRQGYNNQVWNIEREKYAALSPVDDSSSSLTFSTSVPIAMASVDLAYTLYSLENTYGAEVFGPDSGLDGRPSSLDAYNHLITDKGTLPVLKLNGTIPLDFATVRGSYSSSSGTIDKTLAETTDGLDFNGDPVTETVSASGSVDRTFNIAEAGVSIPLPYNLMADASGRYTHYEAKGAWEAGTADEEPVASSVSVVRYQGRAIWRPMTGLSVDFGAAYVARTYQQIEHAPGDGEETITTDFVGGVTYRRADWLSFRLSHRVGDIENPFTRLAPTDRNSTRATLTLTSMGWLDTMIGLERGVAYHYYAHDAADPGYPYNSEVSDIHTFTVGLRTDGFPYLEGLDGYMTYTRGRLGMSIPIATSSPPWPTILQYDDVSYTVVGGMTWAVMEGLDVTADGTWYRSRGQWPLYRLQRRLGIAKAFTGFTVLADVRMVQFNEVAGNKDDYDATLVTLGVRWGF